MQYEQELGRDGGGMALGRRIKECRESSGRSQVWLASQLGVNRSTVFRYEKGDTKKITRSTLEKIAELLGTTKEYLLYGRSPINLEREYGEILNTMQMVRSSAAAYGRTRWESGIKEEMLDAIKKEGHFFLLMESTVFSPRIIPGDRLTVITSDVLQDKHINVLLKEGRVLLRRAFIGEESVTFTVDNQSIYPEIHDKKTVGDSFLVIGYVEKIEVNNP